jgi:hypothetical protein
VFRRSDSFGGIPGQGNARVPLEVLSAADSRVAVVREVSENRRDATDADRAGSIRRCGRQHRLFVPDRDLRSVSHEAAFRFRHDGWDGLEPGDKENNIILAVFSGCLGRHFLTQVSLDLRRKQLMLEQSVTAYSGLPRGSKLGRRCERQLVSHGAAGRDRAGSSAPSRIGFRIGRLMRWRPSGPAGLLGAIRNPAVLGAL